MNFGMILLCLAIGCLIGFEAGRIFAVNRMRSVLDEMAAHLKAAAAEQQKKKEEAQKKKKEDFDYTMQLLNNIRKNREEIDRYVQDVKAVMNEEKTE